MKVDDVLACSFTSWYNLFKNITEESIIIPLPAHFLDYLHTDGVVLPESSAHGIHQKASNLAMDGDEEDSEIRDDELMKMYEGFHMFVPTIRASTGLYHSSEADWSPPANDTASIQTPEFGAFEGQIKEAIHILGGRVFPKLNWSCPKDASWISFDKSLMCTCPCDVYLLLKSSEFIAHDLDMPFSGCEDESKDYSRPVVSYDLILRKWNPPHPASEFRCFIKDKKIVGISQRNVEKFYECIGQEKDSVLEDLQQFFSKKIVSLFPLSKYVIDVVRLKKGHVWLVDFNPWGPVTDGLMFEWEEIEALSQSTDTLQVPEFRYVLSEKGVKMSSHAMYSLPQDVVDLAAGEAPFKLMDLMKLTVQKPGETDSSSEEDAN